MLPKNQGQIEVGKIPQKNPKKGKILRANREIKEIIKDQEYHTRGFLETLCPKEDRGGYFFSQCFFPGDNFLAISLLGKNLKCKPLSLKKRFFDLKKEQGEKGESCCG